MYVQEKTTQTLTPLYVVKNKNTNPNLRCSNRRNRDNIDTLDTLTLLLTFLTGFRQNQDSYQMVIQLICLVHKRIQLVFEYKR